MMFDVVMPSEQISWDVYRAAFDHGAYFEDSGTHMVTTAFTDADVDHALAAFEKGAREVAERHTFEADALSPERLAQFRAEAFGGELDDEVVRQRIEQTVQAVVERDPALARRLDPSCG
jgi:glutamate-1-semialdehyde 2,1-aminomutase/neamine transaminase/2'-deamino-2'-hydroxyneamine transaminase/neomycin C transaminase